MEKILLTIISNSFLLMSFCVFFGTIFGKIQFGKMSFGASGSMFIGIMAGWSITKIIYGLNPADPLYSVGQNLLSKELVDKGYFDLFLILFIASVGLLAAKEVGRAIKKYGIQFILLGFLITGVGAMTTYGVSLIGSIENPYLYSGAYTGSLTSSPGLAASLETARSHSIELLSQYSQLSDSERQRILKIIEGDHILNLPDTETLSKEKQNIFIKKVEAAVGTGYAVSYPFGVIIVIFAMNIFPVIFKINIQKDKLSLIKDLYDDQKQYVENGRNIQEKNRFQSVYFDLSAYVLVCVVGLLIGTIKIPLFSFGKISLGSTGGVLVAALILGHIGRIGFLCFRMNNQILSVIRAMTLSYFFSNIGIRYGYQVITSLSGPGLILVFASILIGTIPMAIGFTIGHYLFKINWIMLSGAICGGMTSTPGLGAAIDSVKSDEPAAGYGAVYPFALLGMVIFSIILNRYI